MLKYLSKVLCFLGIISNLAGCAYSQSTVPMNAVTINPNSIHKAAHHTAIDVKVIDVRGTDPKFLVNKFNAYGATSGQYLADKPLADLVGQTLTSALKTAGYTVNNNSSRVLTAEIVRLDSKVQDNFVNLHFLTDLQINFKIVDAGTQNVVWNQTINGHSKQSTVILTSTDVIAGVNSAISEATINLVNSPEFNKVMHN